MKRLYELTYLIPGELSEKEIETFQKKVEMFIVEEKGEFYNPTLSKNMELGKAEAIVKKPFYFEKKRGIAFLKTINFYLDSEKIEVLKQKLKQEKQPLRSILLTKREPITEAIKKPPRVKIKPFFQKTAEKKILKPKKTKLEKPKVELKEIDKKLEEILGE